MHYPEPCCLFDINLENRNNMAAPVLVCEAPL